MNHCSDTAEYKVKIKVIGVGGGAINAVSYMIEHGMTAMDCIAIDTDTATLNRSKAAGYLDIGTGLKMFCQPSPHVVRQHCEQYRRQLRAVTENVDLIFLTVCLGGGTGSGAAPLIAEESIDADVPVFLFATLPFEFEGKARMDAALDGLKTLKERADVLLVMSGEQMVPLAGATPVFEVFHLCDAVLYSAVRAMAGFLSPSNLLPWESD